MSVRSAKTNSTNYVLETKQETYTSVEYVWSEMSLFVKEINQLSFIEVCFTILPLTVLV
jgi:hypothetical protein